MPSLRGSPLWSPVSIEPKPLRGPLEGRHSAFPRAVRRAGPGLPTMRLRRIGKAECLPSAGRPLWSPVSIEPKTPSRSVGGKAFCLPSRRQARRPWIANDAPSAHREGRMPSLRGRPLWPPVSIEPKPLRGPLEGRHSAFPRAVRRAGPGSLTMRLRRIGKAECLPSKGRPLWSPVVAAPNAVPGSNAGDQGVLRVTHHSGACFPMCLTQPFCLL